MRAAELSIIVPTFNERANITGVISAVSDALPDVAWEIIFVDDNSSDGTASLVREIAAKDPRVRCLHRFGRRGLSSACVEGIMSTSAPIVAVMDADRQHDERALAPMFHVLRTTDADLAVGSRYIEGGGVGDWNARRVALSRFATQLTNRVTRLFHDTSRCVLVIVAAAFVNRVQDPARYLRKQRSNAEGGRRSVRVPFASAWRKQT
jgi:dolichol-phosphate mannosyltransferase